MGVCQIGNRNSVGGPKRECGLWNREKEVCFWWWKRHIIVLSWSPISYWVKLSFCSHTQPWIVFAVFSFCFLSVVLLFHVHDLFRFFISGNGRPETRQLFDTFLFLSPYIQSFTSSLSLKYCFNWFTFLIFDCNIQFQAKIVSCLDHFSALLPHFLVFIFASESSFLNFGTINHLNI